MTLTDFANRVKSRLDALGEPWEPIDEPQEATEIQWKEWFVTIGERDWYIHQIADGLVEASLCQKRGDTPDFLQEQDNWLTAVLNGDKRDDAGNVVREVTG